VGSTLQSSPPVKEGAGESQMLLSTSTVMLQSSPPVKEGAGHVSRQSTRRGA